MKQRVSAQNKAVYTSHRLLEPTYPKTVIVPINTNEYIIKYAHGRPLSDFTIDTCPDSVFNYDCQYYQSLLALKTTYLTNIERVKYQLEAFDESLMNKYIDDHIDAKYLAYSSNVRNSIEELSALTPEAMVSDISQETMDTRVTARDLESLSEAISSDLSEFQSALDSVEDVVYDELTAEWFRMHNTSPESERYCKDLLAKWEIGLGNLSNEFRAWKEDALREATDYEKQQIIEYQSIPHTVKEINNQLRKLYRTEISKATQEIKASALDIIITKLPSSALSKYEDQLTSIIMLHSKCKCYGYIDRFMETVKNKMTYFINKLKLDEFTIAIDFYELKKYLFPIVNSTVNAMSHVLFTEMRDRLDLIQSYTDNVTNMQHMKRIATSIVGDINTNLDDMDIVINDIDDDSFRSLNEAIMYLNESYIVKSE